jgi:hypothetical protein
LLTLHNTYKGEPSKNETPWNQPKAPWRRIESTLETWSCPRTYQLPFFYKAISNYFNKKVLVSFKIIVS